MKKVLLAFLSCSVMSFAHAQNIFTYGKHAVSKEEFLRAFNKNPNSAPDKKKALREYLDLYINFKLKVRAAYDAGLEKDQTQQYELQNFRRQMAENIINEQANIKELVKEAFDRSQKDIHLAHVFVEVPAYSDTTAAYQQIWQAYKALQQGQDFGKVSETFSSDPSTKQTAGDLGYITAFTLPYEFENHAYQLKPNTYSQPVRTSIGYHIFKNKGERKPLGIRRVAQILIAFPPNGSEVEKRAAMRKADSVYTLLKSGRKFEELVATVSNDLSTNNNAGQLPEFGVGTYSPAFEEAAFGLTKPGDIAKPVASSYGYHIIKLLETKPVATDMKDEGYYALLQERVTKDQRLTEARKGLLNKQLAAIKYKAAVFNQQDLFAFTDTNVQKTTIKPLKSITENTVLFSFSNQQIKAGDWLKFVRAVKTSQNEFSGKPYKELFTEYLRITADENYRSNLEKYNAEFDKQLKEFREANLLFGVMEKNVWGKANEDNAGLQAYYNLHKSKYTWAPSADALVITAANELVAKELTEKLKNNLQNWRSITEAYPSQVAADSGRYELTQLPAAEKTSFSGGDITAPVANPADGSVTFNYVIKIYPQQEQRSFDDARGMVISDYQQVLEQRWLAELKKKYPVKINEAVFATLK